MQKLSSSFGIFTSPGNRICNKRDNLRAEFQNEPNACTIDRKEQTMIRQRSPSTGEAIVARIWPAKDGIVQVALGYAHSTTANDPSDTLGDKGIECNSLRSVREIYDVAP
jgi:hypothetical protein